MSRRVFFSFHYQRDIWRVNQIRNIPNVMRCSAAGFQDASLWEDAKGRGEAAIKRLIDNGLMNTSVTVVCIGAKTAGRKYINYEIEQSMLRGNGIVGIQIHHIEPINKGDVVWTTTPQGLVEIGRLFIEGRYDSSRKICVVGSEVVNPKFYKCNYGINVSSMLKKENENNCRVISGNVLTGYSIGFNGNPPGECGSSNKPGAPCLLYLHLRIYR